MLRVNGREENFTEEISVLEFLNNKGVDPPRVIVAINDNVVNKDSWESVLIKDGDEINVLKIVGGG